MCAAVNRQNVTKYDNYQLTSTTLEWEVNPGGVPGASNQKKRGMEARVEPSLERDRQMTTALEQAGGDRRGH
jgi:hypothetical protein